MIRQIIFIHLICFILATTAWAHPHAFVECKLSFVMDNKGVLGFKQHWTLDEMTTVSVLDVIDTDRNGVLSMAEESALRDLSINSLKDFHYFTIIQLDGKNLPVTKITDFKPVLKNNKLAYDFFVPYRIEAKKDHAKEVKVAVFDDTFYTFVVYTEEGQNSFDPTKDPLFVIREAPATPNDFERFSKSVGITKYTGKVNILGSSTMFNIESKVEEAPEMAYFYNQITPQAFVLTFKPK